MENTMPHLTIRQINIIIELLKEYKALITETIESAKLFGASDFTEKETQTLNRIELAIENLENIKV